MDRESRLIEECVKGMCSLTEAFLRDHGKRLHMILLLTLKHYNMHLEALKSKIAQMTILFH